MIAGLDPARLPVGREGRILAIGLAVLIAGLFWLTMASPLIGWYGARGRALEMRIDYAGRMAAIAADLPSAERAAAAAKTGSAPSSIILAGSSDPVAAAALESLVDGLTHDAGATLISTESIPAVQTGTYRRIGLHVTTRAPWTNLVGLLAAIERTELRMSVGELQIQAGPLGGAEQLLDMSMSVTAFRAGTAAVPPPGDAADDASGGSTRQ